MQSFLGLQLLLARSLLRRRSRRACVRFICTFCMCVNTNTYTPRFNPYRFFGPSRCLVPTPGLTSKCFLIPSSMMRQSESTCSTASDSCRRSPRRTTPPMYASLSKVNAHSISRSTYGHDSTTARENKVRPTSAVSLRIINNFNINPTTICTVYNLARPRLLLSTTF